MYFIINQALCCCGSALGAFLIHFSIPQYRRYRRKRYRLSLFFVASTKFLLAVVFVPTFYEGINRVMGAPALLFRLVALT